MRTTAILNKIQPGQPIKRDLISSYVLQRKPFRNGNVSASWQENLNSEQTFTIYVDGVPTYVWDQLAEMWFQSEGISSTEKKLLPLIRPKHQPISVLPYGELMTLQRYGAGYLVAQKLMKAR